MVFGLLVCFVPDSVHARQPNIIYINIDDLGWTDLSCQGSAYYRTPNIDQLAAQGMRFTSAYAPAANCAPSRACCLTGQNTPRHGVYTVGGSARGESRDRKLIPTKNTKAIAQDNLTIAHILHSAGYKSAHVGKWHISGNPQKNGFDVNIAGNSWGLPKGGGYHSPYKYPNCIQKEKGEYLTDRLTSDAIGFVKEHAAEPFFLYLSYYAVHKPLEAKADKEAECAERKKSKAHNHPTYAAMIETLDENIGRLMASLKELDIDNDTMVLFTSDNGGIWAISRQWPLRAGKGAYYEGGIRVPLLVRWPGRVPAGTVCDIPVSGLDYLPTFAAAAGTEVPENKVLDGVNLIPLLTQTGDIADRPLFWHFPIYLQAYDGEGYTTGYIPETRDPKFRTRPGSVVRHGDWKLHEYFEDSGLELYNLKEDVGEKMNVAEQHPEKVKALHALLKTWRQQMGAPVPTEQNPEYQP